MPPTSTYAIGGVVSGLVGSLVIQSGTSETLTITTNGAFVFQNKIPVGAAYSTTILTQPAGQICTLARASGTTNGTVSDIGIACSNDPTAFYLALTATPAGSSGVDGIYAISSKEPGATPRLVTNQKTRVLSGLAQRNGSPAALVYHTVGAAGGDHLWAVDLTGASNLQPRQLSTWSVGRDSVVCSINPILEDLDDPSSAFFVLGVPTTSDQCGGDSSTHRFSLVRYSDSANQDAIDLPFAPADMQPLYAPDGALGGIVMRDAIGDLRFYRDSSFTQSTVLLRGVSAFATFDPGRGAATLGSPLGAPTATFLQVFGTGGTVKLHRIDHTGAISAALLESPVWFQYPVGDAEYLYFTETVADQPLDQRIYRVAVGGAATAEELYRYTPAHEYAAELELLGVVAGRLVLRMERDVDPVTSVPTMDIAVMPVNGASPPAAVSTVQGFWIHSYMAGDRLFINQSPDTVGRPKTTEIRSVDGVLLQPATLHSNFISASGDSVLQVRDMSEDTPRRGGTMARVRVDSSGQPILTPLTFENSATPFAFANTEGTGFAVEITEEIVIGGATGDDGAFALLFDLTRNTVVPIRMPGTHVRFVVGPWY